VIPPAWTDVWICADPHGHVQATGRDQRGRKQFRYHDEFRSDRENLKFGQLVEFGEALTAIRRQVDADLLDRTPSARRQVALVVHLLDLTALRVGNERYARENGTFGLSTLRRRQVHVVGSDIDFSFVGKSGKRQQVHLHDRRLARLVHACQDLPGQELFTYAGADGQMAVVRSNDVNDYVRGASDTAFTAKTFRTWIATTETAAYLAPVTPPPTKHRLIEAIDRTAGILGNTRAVCRASYIHPAIELSFMDGSLSDVWGAGPKRPTAALSVAERRTLYLLQATAS
jgi:DNA topoisomerase-1